MTIKRWTVTELTRYLRQLFEMDYRLQDLEVEGEVSNFRIPRGHAYFTLKDADAQLRCVMWRSAVQSQAALPQDGEQVIAHGHVSVYEAGGQYQLYCTSLRPAGVGDLHARFEELKARLQAEGLFDPERKRLIPARPAVIGLVTSPGAAALQDVLKVLTRRYPLARVVLSPTAVQGDQAPPQIVAALEALNDHAAVDVILVVRGGGSLEDLWCFNDERVVRAIAASRIPVVSGVGHEVDFTLADFAADLRAPTPSAAAEQVTPLTADDLRAGVRDAAQRLDLAAESALVERRRVLDGIGESLRRLSPQAMVDNARQRIDALLGRAGRAVHGGLRLRRERLVGVQKTLHAMNPQATLARGYAIVRGPDGVVLRRAADVSPGQHIDVRLLVGRLRARVESHGSEDQP
jgi:exodeoxyribonuclease VII large subunit